MRAFMVLLAGLLASFAVRAQPGAGGRWEGEIRVLGQSLRIRVDFTVAAGEVRGTIDIPQQNAAGLSLRAVRAVGDSLSFELPAGPGVANFEGVVSGDSAWGLFRQAGVAGTFHLRRGEAASSGGTVPVVAPPYGSHEVSFRSGGVALTGTLTIPLSGGSHPAVILLTGSGAQTRDEDVFGFKVFATLADTLTRSGLAVLRFDDRGTGGSGGSAGEATTQGYSADALAALEFLAAYPGIDGTRIGLLGHSEGAVAAGLAAVRKADIAFLVLMAGPSLRGDRVILGQMEDLGRAAGMNSMEIEEQVSLQERVYEAARSDTGWDSLRVLLVRNALRRDPGADSLARMQVEGQLMVARSQWFRSFIDLDPLVALRRVSVPVLALLGEKDTQVPPAANRQPFEELGKGMKNLTIVVVPGANHLFQNAMTGLPGEYGALRKEFSAEFLERLIPWLLARTGLR